ncbi:lds, partial [Drosophila busckii]
LACKNHLEKNPGTESDCSADEEETTKNLRGWSSKGRKDDYNGGTLVVCPASLLRQWEGEVNSKLSRHRLTVCVHHGANRESKGKHLKTYDMVVTTYNIVSREHKTNGALFGVKWRRIILDEAHVVRNFKSQSSCAFLRCSPFDDLNTWKKWIDNKSAGGQNRLNLLMKSLMLRRNKAQLQIDGKMNDLPAKEIRLIEMKLDTDEMNVYQKMLEDEGNGSAHGYDNDAYAPEIDLLAQLNKLRIQ